MSDRPDTPEFDFDGQLVGDLYKFVDRIEGRLPLAIEKLLIAHKMTTKAIAQRVKKIVVAKGQRMETQIFLERLNIRAAGEGLPLGTGGVKAIESFFDGRGRTDRAEELCKNKKHEC